jgi:hypothetical protein
MSINHRPNFVYGKGVAQPAGLKPTDTREQRSRLFVWKTSEAQEENTRQSL